MSQYLRDTAYVLLSEPFREQDVWLTLYGQQHGKLVGIARGVRSARSKQRGHMEPFSKIEVMLAKGGAYDKIAVVQTCASSDGLRESLSGMAIFGRVVALVARSTEQGVPNERIFLLLDELHRLLSAPEVQRVSTERSALILAAFTLQLLDAEGYAMDFDQCRVCGEALNKDRGWLSLEQGGIVCQACVTKIQLSPSMGAWISAPVLQAIRFFARAPLSSVLALSAPRSILQEVSGAVDQMTHVLPRSQEVPASQFLFSLG